jgi:hypothetical protein
MYRLVVLCTGGKGYLFSVPAGLELIYNLHRIYVLLMAASLQMSKIISRKSNLGKMY